MARVLLLEPNAVLARQYQTYLKSKGHEVVWAQKAQEAINHADKTTPNIVILEPLLTAHSGIEFLHEFRSYAEWRAIPVLVLSQLSRDDNPTSQSMLDKLGVRAYLYKPETSLERLSSRLTMILADQATPA